MNYTLSQVLNFPFACGITGYLVVRIGEEELKQLDINDSRLQQFNHPWSYEETRIEAMATKLDGWAREKFGLAARRRSY